MNKTTIAFVGCSKTKRKPDGSGYLAARDLYAGQLFAKRVEHVERRGLPWYILSAKSGLLKPSVSVRPYDATIGGMSEIEVAEWNLGVANQLMSELWFEFGNPALKSVVVELHAGAKYCEPLGSILSMFGVTVVKPVEKLGIGKQLAFYDSSVRAT